jgi:hypothetical protein
MLWHPNSYMYSETLPSHHSKSEPLTCEAMMKPRDQIMRHGFKPEPTRFDMRRFAELERRLFTLSFLDYSDVIAPTVHDAVIYEGLYDKLKAIAERWVAGGGKVVLFDSVSQQPSHDTQAMGRMIRDNENPDLKHVENVTVAKRREVEPGVYVEALERPIPGAIQGPSWDEVKPFDYSAEEERLIKRERLEFYFPKREAKKCEKCDAPITAMNTDGKCHCED